VRYINLPTLRRVRYKILLLLLLLLLLFVIPVWP
jgi:hypothetical protein